MFKYFLSVVAVLCLFSQAGAQLCQGSLGAPVVNIEFGAGKSRFGPALAPGLTSYNYVSVSPNDGQYTIVNTTAGLNGGWVTTTDHTGDPGGYMMLINASYQPGIFYTQTINGLCPGTTYEFAAWIKNLLNYQAAEPNVTFRIEGLDGTLLTPVVNTGNIAALTGWLQYAAQFTTPAAETSVVIKLINNGPGGIGNDLVLDDITFRPCGPILTTSIDGNSSVSNVNLCQGTDATVTLSASYTGGYNVPAFQWQVNTGVGWADIAGATSLNTKVVFNGAAAGVYQYRLAAGENATFGSVQCRVYSAVSTVIVNTYPVATASNSGPYCPGGNIELTASGGTSYSWTGPGGYLSTQQSPVIKDITAQNAGLYQVSVTKNGCQSVAATAVEISVPITPVVSGDVSICQGTKTVLQAGGGTSYTWSPAVGLSATNVANPTAAPDSTTTYYVQVSNGVCMQTDSIKVTVTPPAKPNAGADQIIIAGQSVELNAKIKGPYLSFYWQPTDYLTNPSALDPVATPPVDITYTLYVVSSVCNTASSAVTIKVEPRLVITNTFTPNGDGINDVWQIDGLDYYKNALVQIYSRWGAEVYESRGYSAPWDGNYNGQHLPAGIYYYVIDLNNGQPKLKGWVLLAR